MIKKTFKLIFLEILLNTISILILLLTIIITQKKVNDGNLNIIYGQKIINTIVTLCQTIISIFLTNFVIKINTEQFWFKMKTKGFIAKDINEIWSSIKSLKGLLFIFKKYFINIVILIGFFILIWISILHTLILDSIEYTNNIFLQEKNVNMYYYGDDTVNYLMSNNIDLNTQSDFLPVWSVLTNTSNFSLLNLSGNVRYIIDNQDVTKNITGQPNNFILKNNCSYTNSIVNPYIYNEPDNSGSSKGWQITTQSLCNSNNINNYINDITQESLSFVSDSSFNCNNINFAIFSVWLPNIINNNSTGIISFNEGSLYNYICELDIEINGSFTKISDLTKNYITSLSNIIPKISSDMSYYISSTDSLGKKCYNGTNIEFTINCLQELYLDIILRTFPTTENTNVSIYLNNDYIKVNYYMLSIFLIITLISPIIMILIAFKNILFMKEIKGYELLETSFIFSSFVKDIFENNDINNKNILNEIGIIKYYNNNVEYENNEIVEFKKLNVKD